MLNSYLNQTEKYQKKTGTNTRGEAVYDKARTLKCRRVVEDIYTPAPSAIRIGVQTVYYLTDKVSTGDLLGGKEIKTVQEYIGLQGTPQGFKVTIDG